MSEFGIVDFMTYLVGTIAIILLPGPNSMYCLYVASSQGVKQGYKTVLAIFLGDFLLILAAVLGAATLLKTQPTLFLLFKSLGGLYLAYIGISLLISAYKKYGQYHNNSQGVQDGSAIKPDNSLTQLGESRLRPKTELTTKEPQKKQRVFIKAFTLSISNPKAILFFFSFFIQFVDPNYHNPALSFAILGISLQLVSISYLSVLIFSGARLATFFKNHHRLSATASALVGLLFIGFAITLWQTQAA